MPNKAQIINSLPPIHPHHPFRPAPVGTSIADPRHGQGIAFHFVGIHAFSGAVAAFRVLNGHFFAFYRVFSFVLNGAVGQTFQREEIPALFGEVFNPGNWNVGHVTLNDKKAHVLLVTLNKQGKAQEHKYLDHWIDEHHFHWQSQNSTTPESKRGQEIIEHVRRGIAIHLFVRDGKLAGGKAAPFVYHGRATYGSHLGSGPMSFVFSV